MVFGRKEAGFTIHNNNEQNQNDGEGLREKSSEREKGQKEKTSPASSGRWTVNKVSLSAS